MENFSIIEDAIKDFKEGKFLVVVDDEDEIYQKFRNIKEATAYFNEMKEIYQHTPKTFFLSLVRTNVIIKK